jgi:hypothetical protein
MALAMNISCLNDYAYNRPSAVLVWRTYREKYADMRGFSRFYFVTHSPDKNLRKEAAAADDPAFVLWDVEHLAVQVVRGGLTGWLLNKAS